MRKDLVHWRLSRQKQTQREVLLKNTPSLDVPVTVTLGRVNEDSFPEMLSVLTTKYFAMLDESSEGTERLIVAYQTRNIGGFSL